MTDNRVICSFEIVNASNMNHLNRAMSSILIGMVLLFDSMQLSAQPEFRESESTITDSAIFQYTGNLQTWYVPDSVGELHVEVYGAQGGSGKFDGGKGGKVTTTIKVKAGEKLFIQVGAESRGTIGGYNGGGDGCGKGFGGGGASDIRLGANVLEKRAIVARGGGGSISFYQGHGGAGGGLMGANGSTIYDEAHIAEGGSQEKGGKGAKAYYTKSGELGNGGDGISSHKECSNEMLAGGGGGFYGGGGSGAGGAGGGSSYTNSEICSETHHEQGVKEDDGIVKIYWRVSKNP